LVWQLAHRNSDEQTKFLGDKKMNCSVEGIIEITSEYKRIIRENDSSMVLLIVADWCGNCQIMAPMLKNLAFQYRGKIKFVMVDADANPEIGKEYDLDVLPLFLFFRNSRLIDQVMGTVPSSLLNKKMKALVEVSSNNNMFNIK
jgi:thioredoxin 1